MVTLEGNFVPLLENRKLDLWRKLTELQIDPQAWVLQLSPTQHHSPAFISFTKIHAQPCALVFSKGFQKQQSDLRAWESFPSNVCTRGGSEVQMPVLIWSQDICPHSSKPSCPGPLSRIGFCPLSFSKQSKELSPGSLQHPSLLRKQCPSTFVFAFIAAPILCHVSFNLSPPGKRHCSLLEAHTMYKTAGLYLSLSRIKQTTWRKEFCQNMSTEAWLSSTSPCSKGGVPDTKDYRWITACFCWIRSSCFLALSHLFLIADTVST